MTRLLMGMSAVLISDSPLLRLMVRVAEQLASIAAATSSRFWTVQDRSEESCGMTPWNDDGEWITDKDVHLGIEAYRERFARQG
jgi:hypothetical protein